MKTKKKEDLPGYPHYPQSEDITSRQPRADNDVEQLGATGKSKIPVRKKDESEEDQTPDIIPGTDADLDDEDLMALGDPDQDLDDGDDENLIPNIRMNDELMGGDLDFPSDEDPDEDEENNFYSRGQD
jgi:hypothetical protein